jgi:dienelactone hydrolase
LSLILNRRHCLAAAAFGLGLGRSAPTAFAGSVETRRTVFQSRGRDHVVFVMEPAGAGDLTGAAILLLHGSGGLAGSLRDFHREAAAWTLRGCTVVIPDYFSGAPDAAQTDDTGWWAEAVRDASAWTLGLSGVDPDRLGALGYSRGGYLAAEVAVQSTAIRAVVGVASAGNVAPGDIVRRPQVLLIHADRDPVIPPARTRRWAGILENAGVPVTTVTMRSSEHVFDEPTWRYIFARATGFFVDALAPRPVPQD